MKNLILIASIQWLPQLLLGQSNLLNEEVERHFSEAKFITRTHIDFWGFDLYSPILLVDPQTRAVYANVQDSAKFLRKAGKHFIGQLPYSLNIANTAMEWNGKRWTMILLPLPRNKSERLNLMCHELFHHAQIKLNLLTPHKDNKHLDERNGRVYLRLELEALKHAINAKTKLEMESHVRNALLFRQVRHQIYPGSSARENLLELNEGMAEYTGAMLSNRSESEMRIHFSEKLDEFVKNETFVRSFAYQTIPVYGFLISRHINRTWHQGINANVNLTGYIENAFGIMYDGTRTEVPQEYLSAYNDDVIQGEEKTREETNNRLKTDLIEKFVNGPHFEIDLEKMDISFDPSNIVSLDEYGTVYPSIRVTDNWGVLTVKKGALMSTNWKRITITSPYSSIGGKLINGDGWTLEITNDSFAIKRGKDENYFLERR